MAGPTGITRSTEYFCFLLALGAGFAVASGLGYLFAAGPGSLGLWAHQWAGLAVCGGIGCHVWIHRERLAWMNDHFACSLPPGARTDHLLNLAMLFGVVVMLATGSQMRGLLPFGSAAPCLFARLHHLSARVLAVLVLVHVVRRRSWIARRVRALLELAHPATP